MPINIVSVDGLDPETLAMLQAMYSRNHRPILDRLAEVGTSAEQLKTALKTYYVGYGHKSIGQCGSTTYFLEGLSLLAAKAVQDTRLYNGQETSTRFIDFETQPYINPLALDLQRQMIEFYAAAKPRLARHLLAAHGPEMAGVPEEQRLKAVKARTFDVLRAFLPAGVTTQCSWHTTLTHARDRMVELAHHPLDEVKVLATGLARNALNRFPTAFSGVLEEIRSVDDYYAACADDVFYYDPLYADRKAWPSFEHRTSFDRRLLLSHGGLNRPRKLPVPRNISVLGSFEFRYALDFGSFRDIQRHRDCFQPMPLLTPDMGFEPWYLDQLPPDLREEARRLLAGVERSLNLLYQDSIPRSVVQYYVPIGYRVPCVLVCDYRQLVYIAELRSSKTVHPTLRVVAQKMAEVARNLYLCPVYSDDDAQDFSVKRGAQDIERR